MTSSEFDVIGTIANRSVRTAHDENGNDGLALEQAPGSPPLSAFAARQLAELLLTGADALDRAHRPGTLLRRFREDSGQTMGDVARTWKVSVPHVSDLERGKWLPDDDMISLIAQHYHLTDAQSSTVRAATKRELAQPTKKGKVPCAPPPCNEPFGDSMLLGTAGNFEVHTGLLRGNNLAGMVHLTRRGKARLLYLSETRALAALLNVAGDSLEARVDREIARMKR